MKVRKDERDKILDELYGPEHVTDG
jgi:hypothetical protein